MRESTRARSARLVIDARGTLEVVVPRRYPEPAIDRLLETHHGWIERQLARRQRSALGLELPGTVWLDGRHLPIIEQAGRRSSARLTDEALVVSGPRTGAVAAIERWYRAEARARVHDSLAAQAPAIGVRTGSVRIGDQRTRWGSCSRTGTLSFSWRLVLAPAAVLDYVVAHELCHRRQLNHSPAFWRLVEAACPDWRAHAAWLRTHGHELQAYEPSLVPRSGSGQLA